jgi:hypothetical protein
MRALLFCASQLAIIDLNTNSFSAIAIAEEYNVSAFPTVITQICISALVVREATEPGQPEGIVRLRLDSQEIMAQSIRLDFQGRLRLRAVNVVQGLVIPGPGTLTCSLTIGDVELGAWDIAINQIGRPQSDVFTAPSDPPPTAGH